MRRFAISGGLILLFALPALALAQRPTRAPIDSTSRRCLDVGWLDQSATCEGRLLNTAALSIIGAGSGALAGWVGGAVAPAPCIGNAERSAVRGAIAGAAVGTLAGLVTRHISRRERAERTERSRAAALRDPAHPWSWRALRPAAITLGTVAMTGAAIGAVQGQRSDSPCNGGPGRAALTGAGVYAAGGATTIAGSMLAIRFLF